MNVLNPHEELEHAATAERAMVDTCSAKIYGLIKSGLVHIGGLDVAAGVCGTNAGDLTRSIDRNGRRLCIEHVMALMTRIRRYNGAAATQIAASFVWPAGLLVFPRVEMSTDEENRRLKAKLSAVGNAMGLGDSLIEDALKTP